jgi:hypothetical protein
MQVDSALKYALSDVHDIPTTIKLLEEARLLIAEPSQWTTGTSARDAKGYSTLYSNPDATCFCSVGAILRANSISNYHRHTTDDAIQVLRSCLTASGSVATFNDTHTHEEVLQFFDDTINRAKALAA